MARRAATSGERWLLVELSRAEFRPGPWPGVVQSDRAEFRLLDQRVEGDAAPRLRGDNGAELPFVEPFFVPFAEGGDPRRALEVRAFTSVAGRLFAAQTSLDTLGPQFALEVPLGRGYARGERRRIEFGPVSGNGFMLLPGESWTFSLPDGPRRRLTATFALTALPLHGPADPVGLTIHLDGEVLFDVHVEPDAELGPRLVDVDVVLPSRAGELRFAVSGRPARTGLLAPRIHVERAEASPPPRTVALFLADTFRADLLGEEVADGPLLPHLSAFAARGLAFTSARSPSNWTLPATASLFSALDPAEHGVQSRSNALGADWVTLAGRLRDLGWRTAAITDGGFVRRAFGLERGFEVFVEESRSGNTAVGLEHVRALLESADPRPLLVVFHTYRAHGPYRVDAATRDAIGAELGLGADYETLTALLGSDPGSPAAAVKGTSGGAPGPRERAALLAELRALYRGGARDLDRAFGAFLDVLEQHGRHDVVVFTSDHGEGFEEHGGFLGHGDGLWEEQLAVPLLVSAPTLAPAQRNDPVSLVDVPRSLFELLDLAPDAQWGGVAVFGRAQPVGTRRYGLVAHDEIVALEGTLKMIATGEALASRTWFDLARDPGERAPLDAGIDPRVGPAATEWINSLEVERPDWRTPRATPAAALPSNDVEQQLAALGYAGE